MDIDERLKTLESSVSYLLSEVSAERFDDIEQQIKFLLGRG